MGHWVDRGQCYFVDADALAYRNTRFLRPAAYSFAGIMLLNGIGHICATILGRTFSSVRFNGTAPALYSSPLVLAASVYLLVRLRRSSTPKNKS
jgi:hypothetical protein